VIGASGNGAAHRHLADPFMSFEFTVSVDTKNGTQVIGGFSDVTGLGAETEVETLRAGGQNDAEVTLPGPTKFPSRLVLKRGLGDSLLLWNWYLKILDGAIKRENVTIRLRSADRQREAAWTFREACPVKWSGPELHAGTSAVAFESIDLVHKGFVLPSHD
jgi:phage tail-like protein